MGKEQKPNKETKKPKKDAVKKEKKEDIIGEQPGLVEKKKKKD